MARKKFYNNKTENTIIQNKWKVALYVRLSREDGDKRESDSIANQKKLLNYYIEQNEELLDATTFVDDNYSGTNFQRPGFQNMLSEIKNGSINCVIIKDLSRFGRSYLEAGNYLENVFPKYNVRFISIIDNIDTYSNPESVNDIMVWIKNMMHEYNSQRISANVRATKSAQQKAGKFIGPRAPYGYKKDPKDNHRLIVDEQLRPVIENIFEWYLQGIGFIRIAKKLNDLGIATRADYKKNGNVHCTQMVDRDTNWKPISVTEIITNKVYMGSIAQHKKTTRSYKDHREIHIDEDEHVVLHDMHEPIISKEKFLQAQERKNNYCTKTSRKESKLYPLSGLLRCKDCGSGIMRNPKFAKGKWYVYYKCKGHYHQGLNVCTHNHSIREDLLFESILAAINMQIKTLINVSELLKRISLEESNKANVLDFDMLIKDKQNQIAKIKNNKMECYNDLKDKLIDKNDYLLYKERYDNSLEALNKEITALENEKKLQETVINNELDWLNDIIEYGEISELTREVAVTLIDRIYIDTNKQVTIDFKFRNEYKSLINVISNLGYIEDKKEVIYA